MKLCIYIIIAILLDPLGRVLAQVPINDAKSLPPITITVKSDQPTHLQYRFVKGDSVENVFSRLGLLPLKGRFGMLKNFRKLNPAFPNKYFRSPDLPVPPGLKVKLPLSLDFRSGTLSQSQFAVSENRLIFVNPAVSKSADDFTKSLNMRALAKLSQKPVTAKREVSSVKSQEKVKTKNSASQMIHAPQKDFPYSLGPATVRVPLKKDSELYRRIEKLGIEIPQAQKGKPYAYIEIPLNHHPSAYLAGGRDPQAVAELSSPFDNQSRLINKLEAQALTASRVYSLTDSQGKSGEVGVDPSVGIQLASQLRYSFLDLDLQVNLQKEKFKPDASVVIDQQSDLRYDLLLRQSFNWLGLTWKVGGGMTSIPSFVSVTNTSLQAKHLQVPYAQLGFGHSFYWDDSARAEWLVSYDQTFGAQSGPHKLGSGFRAALLLKSSFPLSESLVLAADGQLSYQDDKPATYQQTELGFQLLFGVRWFLGEK